MGSIHSTVYKQLCPVVIEVAILDCDQFKNENVYMGKSMIIHHIHA